MEESNVYEALRSTVIEYADTGLANDQIFEKLDANHPDLVDAYIETHRASLLKSAIWTIVGQSNRRRRKAVALAEVTELRKAGENLLLNNLPVDGGRKNLVEMTKDDLLYAAEQTEQKANGLIAQADFMRAVAKRVPKGKTVGDVFSAEKIAEFAQRLGVAA